MQKLTEQPKWVQYATLIQPYIAEMFHRENGIITAEEMEDEENLQAFFHALATAVPCFIFNKVTGDNKNHVEFNHTANLICFKFVKIKKEGE